MSAWADHARRTALLTLAVLGAVVISACTPAPAPPVALTDPRGVLLTAPADPAARGVSSALTMIRANLAQFEVTVRATGRTRPEQQALAHELIVATAVAGERSGVEHRMWLAVTGDTGGHPRITSLAADGPRPLWALEPVTVTRGRRAAVIATRAHDGGRWLPDVEAAVDRVSARLPVEGVAVAEFPSNTDELRDMIGSDALKSAGAACWAFGPGARLLLNPAQGTTTTGPARDFLLTHEIVHLATDSAHHQWPTWFVEGYADAVAAQAHRDVEAALDAQLREELHRGAPATLPQPQELDLSRADAGTAYGRARVGVRAMGADADQIQTRLLRGTPFDAALAAHGWSQSRVAEETARALIGLKG